jgi:hypothetical protein
MAGRIQAVWSGVWGRMGSWTMERKPGEPKWDYLMKLVSIKVDTN